MKQVKCREHQQMLDEFSSAVRDLSEIALDFIRAEGEARERIPHDMQNAKFVVGATMLAIDRHMAEHGCGLAESLSAQVQSPPPTGC